MAFTMRGWEEAEDNFVTELEGWLVSTVLEHYDVEDLQQLTEEQKDQVLAFCNTMPDRSWMRDRLETIINFLEQSFVVVTVLV